MMNFDLTTKFCLFSMCYWTTVKRIITKCLWKSHNCCNCTNKWTSSQLFSWNFAKKKFSWQHTHSRKVGILVVFTGAPFLSIFMKSLKASICFILVACTHYLGCTSVIYTGSNWKPTILYSRFQSKVASQIRLSFFRETFSNYSIKFLLKLAISLEDSCFFLVLFSCPKNAFYIKSAWNWFQTFRKIWAWNFKKADLMSKIYCVG